MSSATGHETEHHSGVACTRPTAVTERSQATANELDRWIEQEFQKNPKVVEVLARKSGNPRWAWDSYRRFVQMYGDVVMGVQKRHENEHEPFDEVMDKLKEEVGAKQDTDLSEGNLKELVKTTGGRVFDARKTPLYSVFKDIRAYQ